MHDLAQLPYLLQVFKEALRLYPPAYIVARSIVQPIELDGYRLTPGMNIGICSYTLHRNPDSFPDRERFDPHRWTPENEATIPRYAYLPFGAGPHVCIGNHVALMEAQFVLAALVQRVTFDLVPGQVIEPEPLTTARIPPFGRWSGGGNGHGIEQGVCRTVSSMHASYPYASIRAGSSKVA